MADAREWYRVPGVGEYPNQEAAFMAAEERAHTSPDKYVEVIRCTEAVVRRYTRQVTVVPEDVSTPEA